MADIVNSQEFDLADEFTFKQLLVRVRNREFDACIASPPCSTFSRARGRLDGPRALRGATGKDAYGLPGLRPAEKDAVRLGTLLAIRAAHLIGVFEELHLPWVFENPKFVQGQVSIFNLADVQRLLEYPGVVHNVVHQCYYGGDFMKPTSFVGRISLSGNGKLCEHTVQEWRIPPTGDFYQGPHAPLSGRRRAVLASDWSEERDRLPTPPDAPFLTRGSAAYPYDLNMELLTLLVDYGAPASLPQAGRFARAGRWGNVLIRTDLDGSAGRAAAGGRRRVADITLPTGIHWNTPLRGPQGIPQARRAGDVAFLGGLRKTALAVAKLPKLREVGRQVRAHLEGELRRDPDLMRRCLDCVGSALPDAGPSAEQLRRVRAGLGSILGTNSVDPLDAARDDCSLCHGLIAAWAALAGDPDDEAASWLVTGAPAGILEHPADRGIFPPAVEDPNIVELADVDFGDPSERNSYASVEDCPHALAEVERLCAAGYLVRCDTLRACVSELGGSQPVVSKFGQVVKVKEGVTKRRLILDSKESGVTPVARKNERIVLPGVEDLVTDALGTMARGYAVDILIMDVTDAFWSLPLRRSERRFFVGKLRGAYYIYKRLAQGSRGAPLCWCRFFALIVRLTQGMFVTDECRLEVYVDDPAAVLGGTGAQRDSTAALIVLAWRALNAGLAFRKGQRSRQVTWIGFALSINDAHPDQCVTVSLMESAQRDVTDLLDRYTRSNLIGVKQLRSLAGKLANAARLLSTWRPFLHQIWAALREAERAGRQTVWLKQVIRALGWFRAFLRREAAGVVRHYWLSSYTKPTGTLNIFTDASPWGFGAFLEMEGRALEYFAVAISELDTARFGHVVGDAAGQQTWECLAALIALRLWRSHWLTERVQVSVKGDNVSLLTMVTEFKAAGDATNVIAMELALDIAGASFKPLVAEHVPGVANVVADALSRRFAPHSSAWRPPAALAQALEAQPPPRDQSWYLTETCGVAISLDSIGDTCGATDAVVNVDC